MRRAVFLCGALGLVACSGVTTTDAGLDAGVDAGVDAGQDAGADPNDATVTFDEVELSQGRDVVALALAPVADGFVVAWAEWTVSPPTLRVYTSKVDFAGQRANLTQTAVEVPSTESRGFAVMVPGALAPLDATHLRLTALVERTVRAWPVSHGGFPGAEVLAADAGALEWALEGGGQVLVRVGDGTGALVPLDGGAPTHVPASTLAGKAVPWQVDGGFTLLTATSTGAVALESLDVSGAAPAWTTRPIAQAPDGDAGLGPYAAPLALRPTGATWLAAWAERSVPNLRTVDVRVQRVGTPAVTVEAEAGWYFTQADVVDTPTGWAVAFASNAEGRSGWNDVVRFRREGSAAPCALNTIGGRNTSSGPIALAALPSGRVGALWAEPLADPPSATRRARLVFRSVGTGFCAP